MFDLIIEALRVSKFNSYWIIWNLFLAFIPLALSVWLFRRPGLFRHQRVGLFPLMIWWSVFIVFVAFLPNAPYLLTDIIHLLQNIKAGYSAWTIVLVAIPQYIIALFLGFEAYVLSLINLGYYLQQKKLTRWITWAELGLHILSAIGIFLGRFWRFNSWDFVSNPLELVSMFDDLLAKWPLMVIAITLVIITALYSIMKPLTLIVAAQRRSRKAKFSNFNEL